MPNLEYLNLNHCRSLEEVHPSLKDCKKLIELNLSLCTKLERFPYVNVESLESLDLSFCSSLEKFPEIHGRMKQETARKIMTSGSGLELHLHDMYNLESLPSIICKWKGLVKLDVSCCSKLESLPEEIGDLENLEELDARNTLISCPPSSIVRLNKLKILRFGQPRSEDGVFFMFPQVNEGLLSLESLFLSYCNIIDGGLPEDIGSLSSLKHLYLCGNNFEHLPRSIAQLGALEYLDLSDCKRLTQLPEEIGDLENLEKLDASYTLISCPPSSIVQLNKLKSLTFAKEKSEDGVYFVFPEVNEGLLSLEKLDLAHCNLIDGGLPEDIGSLSSLEELHLYGNNFEHLPQSISELGALRLLELSDCKRLTQLPEFPQQLDTIYADWSNDSICNLLFQNMSSLQHDICSSHSLSLTVFGSMAEHITRWFNYQGTGPTVSVKLPKNWYVTDNFLGFAVCFSGIRNYCITAHLIPLCDAGMPSMTQKFTLSNNSQYSDGDSINFLLVPLDGLWDASNANGKTPNDYGCIKLNFTGHVDDFGVRLLYKDESELCIGIRKSRYEVEATCLSKKQRQYLQLFPTSSGL